MDRSALFRAELQKIDDSGPLQKAQILGFAGEQLTDVHRVQPFGFHSNPPIGSHGVGLALGGERDLAVLLGTEHPDKRPKNRDVGTTALYDQWGNIISLVEAEMRYVHASKIHLVAPQIVLEGTVLLGGPDAAKPASMQGTVDSAGDTDTGGFATKVLMK